MTNRPNIQMRLRTLELRLTHLYCLTRSPGRTEFFNLVLLRDRSLGATFVATVPSDLGFAVQSLKRVFMPPKYDFHGLMEKVLELANLARREGLLALETYANSGQGDPFLVKCLTLAIDGRASPRKP